MAADMDFEYGNNLVDDKYLILQDLFLKGDDIQKLSIIQALPQLVKIDQQATFSRIVPKIQQELPKASSEFQVTTSQIFRVLIEKEVPVNLLGAVVQGVDSRDPIVSMAWMETLLAVLPLLSVDAIKNEILPLIVNKSQLSQPVIQRVACCRIIGKIANHKNLKPADIKKDVLPFVLSLCQDCSADVRAVICTQLPFVAEGTGANIVKTPLFPCFVELASDNNLVVREAAVMTIVNMFPYIDEETIRGTMVPLIKKFCEKTIPEDSIAAIVASQIGTIAQRTLSCLSMDDKLWFLQFYKVLAHRGFDTRPGGVDASKDVICRDNCATNLPEMAKFVSVAIPAHIDDLYSIFRDLAADPCYIVRRSVAACVHEIATILGHQNKLLKADFVRLLRDDAEDVLQMLVPNLAETLLLLSQYGLLNKDRTDQCTMEISRAMLKCQIELSKGYNWRLLTMFLEQLECLPKCMPCEFIHQHFTPMVLANASNGRAKPVRHQATRTLLIFLRYNNKENQQKWLRDALVTQFCYSDSCYTRQIFVKLCLHAIDVFSSKYFKQHFFMPLVSLADDPVSNVRYSFISVLPKLKLITLLPPLDTKYKVLLQDAITKLDAKEKSGYVLENLKRVCKELLNTNLASNKEFTASDVLKQEEENSEKNVEKPIGTITANQNLKPKVTTTSAANKTRTLSGAGKSPSKPVDMNFLEQHFYIDAGVNLPEALNAKEESGKMEQTRALKRYSATGKFGNVVVKSSVTTVRGKKGSEVNNLSDSELRLLETVTLNMTDDVKVNLRRINKNGPSKITTPRTVSCSNIPQSGSACNFGDGKAKRHSSVFSSTCLEDRDRKLQNRRSLNISSRELSRIPLPNRKKELCKNGAINADGVPNILDKSCGDGDFKRNCDLQGVKKCNDIKIHDGNDTKYEDAVLTTEEKDNSTESVIEGDAGVVQSCVAAKPNGSKVSNLPLAIRRQHK